MKKTKTNPIRDENKKIQPMANEKKNGVNVWKIVAIVFVVLFGFAVAGGLFRIYHADSHMSAPTQEQMDSAKAAVAQELAKSGDDIGNYEATVSSMIRKFGRNPPMFVRMEEREPQGFGHLMPEGDVIHVSLQSETKTHFYLVSVDSGKIIMHSFTEWMKDG